MWIFGKKANNQSGKLEVPPELQSYYYARQAKVARTRLILSVLVLVIVILAAIFGGLWLHDRAISTGKPQVASKQSNQKAKPNSQTIPVSTPQVTTPQPQTPQVASVSTMPNTGPGTAVLLISGGATLIGTVFYYIRQIRALR